jgi:hypothetical protein
MRDVLVNPALPRALVVGLFGGAGLALTAMYSRRGPLIYPVYAALLAALAMLLARYSTISFADRLVAALGGFSVASGVLYVATGILPDGARRRLVDQGRLRPSELKGGVSFAGHTWRVGFLLAVGIVVSAGVAFVSG